MLPTRVITYAWGEKYVDELLSLTLPAVLAPGNLPHVASSVPCQFVILTQEGFFPRITSSPVVDRIREHCPLRLIGLDDLVTAPDKYGMTLTYALHRGFADLGPAMTDTWLIFLNADFILAEGSWRSLLAHLAGGERLVASPSYCVKSQEVSPQLRKQIDVHASTLSIRPREMAGLILRHRHNTVRGKTVNERQLNIRYMDQFYWLVDEQTLIGHQMPVSIVGMRPERYVKEPSAFWDHGLMREFCPEAKPQVIGDSDEFLMMELREKEVAADQIAASWASAKAMGELMVTWVTPYQREFAQYPLTLHAADIPPGIEEARGQLQSFVDEVLSYAPATLPSHIEHPQWLYHRPTFLEARHQYLSSRLGAVTETSPPPESLSEIDRAWWRLDGLEKAHLRRCDEIKSLAAHQRRLIQAAVDRREAEQSRRDGELKHRQAEIDEQIIAALAALPSDLQESKEQPELFPNIVHPQTDQRSSYPLTDANTSEPSPWIEALAAVESEYRVLREGGVERAKHAEFVKKALNYVHEQEQKNLELLTLEFEATRRILQGEYERLLQKPVKSAVIPHVALHRGPIAHGNRTSGHAIRGWSKALYHRLFGRLPRVGQLHPYWAAMRHVVRIVDTEGTRGAKNVLTVTAEGGAIESIANHLPGLHAQVSLAGLKSGNFFKAFTHHSEFDLCICDLGVHELSELVEICGTLKPLMRPGGKIVVFHLNTTLQDVPIDGVLGSGLSGLAGEVQVHWAGSAASARVIRELRQVVLRYHNASYFSRVGVGLVLVGMASRSLMANRREAATPGSLEPGSCTSITVEITV